MLVTSKTSTLQHLKRFKPKLFNALLKNVKLQDAHIFLCQFLSTVSIENTNRVEYLFYIILINTKNKCCRQADVVKLMNTSNFLSIFKSNINYK